MPPMEDEIKDLTEQVKRLVARENGDHSKVIEKLLTENHDYRERHRTDKEKIDAFENKTKDSVILTGDDRKLWEGLKALNLKPEEITTAITERDDLKGKHGELSQQLLVRDVADKLGWKPTVLNDVVTLKKLAIEDRDAEVEVEGEKKTVKLPHVKAGDKFVLLSKYAEDNLQDYLPALRKSVEEGDEVVFPEQSSHRKAGTKDPVADYLDRTYAIEDKKSTDK